MKSIPKVLTIAGSDSGAGAGIQADLKTFAALGVYGTSVITAITAQNTVKVTKIFELSPELVAAQIDAVMQDIGAQALKTGMLANAAIIETTAAKIQHYNLTNLVVDPVMVAKSGDLLLRKDAIEALPSRWAQRMSSSKAATEEDQPSTCFSTEKKCASFALLVYALATPMAPAALFPPPLRVTLPKEKRSRRL